MAAPTLSAMIDPSKQAEYPIVLGERLASDPRTQLINVNYNYKTKSSTPQQRSTITRSDRSRDRYNLSVTDKAPSADHTLTYAYQGSEDPDAERNLVLVFDPDRKVFVLEPVTTKLNFNLRSAPGKTEKQVLEQYEQLRISHEDDHTSGEDRNAENTSEDEGPPDDSNPYDFRHFLRKEGAEDVKPPSVHTTPEPVNTSKANTPVIGATKPAPKPMPRPKKQANPLRETKRLAKAPAAKKPPPPKATAEPPNPPVTRAEPPEQPDEFHSSLSDAGTGSASQQTVQSPNSNIIIDGDLIIDMGSPPPSRPAFKVNPAYFSSNNTPTDDHDDDGDDGMGEFRLPSPARNTHPAPSAPAEPTPEAAGGHQEEEEDDDGLAAEMEAAFEENYREEEAQGHQYGQHTGQYNAASDDESEISEEE